MKGLDCMMIMLGGIAIGAAATLLLAPCSGKEMRKHVCQLMKKEGIPCHCEEDIAKWVEKAEHNNKTT